MMGAQAKRGNVDCEEHQQSPQEGHQTGGLREKLQHFHLFSKQASV